MSSTVYTILQGFVTGNSINISGSSLGADFGSAVETAVANIFSGSIQVADPNFGLTWDQSSVTATLTGTGSSAPLVSEYQVTFTFAGAPGSVTLTLDGSFTGSIPLSDAWPNALNTVPFNQVALSEGTASLTVNPTDTSFDLKVTATAAYSGSNVGTGLLEVTYDNSSLGFLAGFVVSGSWSLASVLPVFSGLTFSGDAGVFFSTITDSDIDSAFQAALNNPSYLPTSVAPGTTIFGSITLTNSLQAISSFLPATTTLTLLATIPTSGASNATVTASLTESQTTGDFQFDSLDLTWNLQTETVSLDVTANFQSVQLEGTVAFAYGTPQSLEGSIAVDNLDWNPFGITGFTVTGLAMEFSLSETGISLGATGDFQIGTGNDAVNFDVSGGIEDFEVPDFFSASLTAASQGANVTLPQLIEAFLPSFPANFPLLDDISFSELSLYACGVATQIPDSHGNMKQYYPGAGATGNITFFNKFNLDFAFSLVTSPKAAVQAMGSLSSVSGGPVVISVGSLNVLTLSSATNPNAGPSACIDTTASGFCQGSGGQDLYFWINGSADLLGLTASLLAEASSDSFEFSMSLDAGGVFTESLAVEFVPATNDFAASICTGFNPPNITIPSLGPIPSFTIPTPQINLNCALGTILPAVAPWPGGMPAGAPYFELDLTFTWGISFSFSLNLDLSTLSGAFSDFPSWVLQQVLSNATTLLGDIITDAAKVAQLLLYLGQQLLEFALYTFSYVANLIANTFNMLIDDATELCQDALSALEQFANCAVSTAEGAM